MTMMPKKFREKILVVDDDERAVRSLSAALETLAPVVGVTDPEEAMQAVENHEVGLAIVDQRMPAMEGAELLARIRRRSPYTIRYLLTGYSDFEAMARAINLGQVHRYIEKPWDVDRLMRDAEAGLDAYRDAVNRLEEVTHLKAHTSELQEENTRLKLQLNTMGLEDDIITQNPEMERLLETVERIARVSDAVLIHGETGTGKELVARRIHRIRHGIRAPFVAINCGALNETLVENELFGHERGAFTGAVRDFPGAFERASGGTVFLDEIGELRWDLQVKLLRVLEEGVVRRVGGTRERRVSTSVLAATHRDLREMVAQGHFREDLFFRLSVLELHIPPLRERREDVPLLLEHFLRQARVAYKRPGLTFSQDAVEALMELPFRGNVRELRNITRKAAAVVRHDLVLAEDLPRLAEAIGLSGEAEAARRKVIDMADDHARIQRGWIPLDAVELKKARDRAKWQAIGVIERAFLDYWYRRCQGNVSLIAKRTGLSRGYLYKMAHRSGFDLITRTKPADETFEDDDMDDE